MAPRKIPTHGVPRDDYGGRLRSATERLGVMEEALAGGHQGPALVLAVQAVTAAADAMTIYHLGERSSASSHQDAIAVFSRLPPLPEIDGARTHLVRVLDHKSEVEYSGRTLRNKEVESIVEHARRFVAFARKHLPLPPEDRVRR
jgi:hypothetical protein